MDQCHCNTNQEPRKRGTHLTLDERGQIQALHRQGYSLRGIALAVGCAHTTVYYELRRGTPQRKGPRGRMPLYNAKRGQAAYEAHRKNSRKPYKIDREDCEPFIQWMATQIRQHKWSIDGCVGYARREHLFPAAAIPSTKTLYNMLWKGKLPISVFEVPRALGRKHRRKWRRKNKRILGRSIEERPSIAGELLEFGHWEMDTVVGKREGKGAAVFTALEKKSRKYIAIKIDGRDCASVEAAMRQLRDEYGSRFGDVFKTMTPDNGPEFETFAKLETEDTKVFFTHPYSSWERPQNERHNGMLREYLPKGTLIDQYSADEILQMADEINSRPRRVLGYRTPDDVFDAFLDQVYAI